MQHSSTKCFHIRQQITLMNNLLPGRQFRCRQQLTIALTGRHLFCFFIHPSLHPSIYPSSFLSHVRPAKGLSWTGSASKAEQKHFRNRNSETRKKKVQGGMGCVHCTFAGIAASAHIACKLQRDWTMHIIFFCHIFTRTGVRVCKRCRRAFCSDDAHVAVRGAKTEGKSINKHNASINRNARQ